jgi:hypothetical protein
LFWVMKESACRTAVSGATEISAGGASRAFPSSTSPALTRAGSSSWFSRIHSSLNTLLR